VRRCLLPGLGKESDLNYDGNKNTVEFALRSTTETVAVNLGASWKRRVVQTSFPLWEEIFGSIFSRNPWFGICEIAYIHQESLETS
jgi:hypothetical protein